MISIRMVVWRVCSSCLDNSVYVDLYNGEDSIVLSLVNAGLAAKSLVLPDLVQLNQSFDTNSDSAPSNTDEYFLIPG